MDTVHWRDEHQSVRRTHSEAKQTETLDFGAEKDLLRAMQGDCCSCPSKPRELPEGF